MKISNALHALYIANYGLFAPKAIRSRERKFQVWNFRSLELSHLELSLLGTFAPWNFRTLGLSLLGTFAPTNKIVARSGSSTNMYRPTCM